MIIGCPKEVKIKEFRVGLVPGGVRALVRDGHKVVVQTTAGLGAGISDEAYQQAGAKILPTADAVWNTADLVVKVKEPIAEEYGRMREGQVLYTFLHLAAEPELTEVLVKKKVKAVGYETVQLTNGELPLLRPMSEVAGRIAAQVGAHYLQNYAGGKGVLLSGLAGVHRGHVVVLGGGVAGANAARIAMGLGARVTIIDIDVDRLEYIDQVFGPRVDTLFSNPSNIEEMVAQSDVLIGAVLLAGAKAPRLVTKEMIRTMEKGSVVVDISIDQGGCIETIRPTSHEEPVYTVHDVIHYGVTNMPGAVARTSTYGLTNVTLKHLKDIANFGLEEAVQKDPALHKGINVYKGHVTCQPVAAAVGYDAVNLDRLL